MLTFSVRSVIAFTADGSPFVFYVFFTLPVFQILYHIAADAVHIPDLLLRNPGLLRQFFYRHLAPQILRQLPRLLCDLIYPVL